MTNVVSLTTREEVKALSIEDHIKAIREQLVAHPGINKAVTLLLDEKAGTWMLHPVFWNMTNGDAFMAMRLAETRLLEGVKEI